MSIKSNENLVERLIDAVRDLVHDEFYESADPNRESSYYSEKKVERIRKLVLKKMVSKP